MKKSVTRIAVAAVFGLAATAVLAGEIILYESPGFQGRRMTLHGTTPDLDRTQFNDRAESIVVRDGVWEVCTDARFAGRCVRLQPGEYPNLQGDLNNRISSVRNLSAQLDALGPDELYQFDLPPVLEAWFRHLDEHATDTGPIYSYPTLRGILPPSAGGTREGGGGESSTLKRMLPLVARYRENG